ncbi:MAG: sugar phosphate isomerase/epimerase family protein [Thermoguttaceae bacterium]
MNPACASRRQFLKRSALVTAGAWLAGRAPAARTVASELSKGAIRLGAPIFEHPADPAELALVHRKLGYRAAYCPNVALDDNDRIRDIREAFAKHDVVIAEVGRWCNLLDPDEVKRKENLAKVTDGLALAEEIGARCCVDIAGSRNAEIWYGPHPDNLSPDFLDAVVDNARTIIDAVKPKHARLAYEMMGWALPDSPDSYLAIIKAVDRDAFGVHLDPCNLVNSPARFYRNTDLLNECFDKLGPWIVSCHAKDIAWDVEMQIHFREVVLGEGSLDYRTFLTRLAALPGDVPLMIEHLKNAEEYAQSRQYLLQIATDAGVPLG